MLNLFIVSSPYAVISSINFPTVFIEYGNWILVIIMNIIVVTFSKFDIGAISPNPTVNIVTVEK